MRAAEPRSAAPRRPARSPPGRSPPVRSGAAGKHFLGGEKPVERGREAGIDGHLHDDLGDFIMRQADIEARLDMHFQLRGGIAHGCQRGNGGDFARPQIKPGTAIDVAERKFEHIAGKVGRDVCQGRQDLLPGFAIDLGERAPSAFQPAFADAVVVLRHSPSSSVPGRHIRQSWCRGREARPEVRPDGCGHARGAVPAIRGAPPLY